MVDKEFWAEARRWALQEYAASSMRPGDFLATPRCAQKGGNSDVPAIPVAATCAAR